MLKLLPYIFNNKIPYFLSHLIKKCELTKLTTSTCALYYIVQYISEHLGLIMNYFLSTIPHVGLLYYYMYYDNTI